MLESVASRQAALGARFPQWPSRSLDGMLAWAAEAFANNDFVVTDKQVYSYAEMNLWVSKVAAGLQRSGVKSGDHVAVVMANYAEFVAVKFAISRVGAIAVPLNFLNRSNELAYLLAQSDANYLVTMDGFRDLNYLHMLDQIMPGWQQQGGGDAFPKLRQVIVFATGEVEPDNSATDFASLELCGAHDDEKSHPEQGRQNAHAIADIIYTSGTTGGPKGVMLSHDMVLRAAYGSAYARAFGPSRRIQFSLPMYHVYGYVEGLLAVMYVGGAIVPQLKFDPLETLRAVTQHRVNDLLLIPTMTSAILEARKTLSTDFPSLNAMLSSGGKAPASLWPAINQAFGKLEITTGYGMTEATASTTVTRPEDPLDRLLTTNGRLRDVGVAADPTQNGLLVAYRVVDTATEQDVAPGELGELRIKGLGVTQGYYNKPEATAAAFDDQGWMKTGDLGSIDTDRYLRLLGRTKESYRCGGEQVLPFEIEALLMDQPRVIEAFVVPVPDQKMGEAGVGFVVVSGAVNLPSLKVICAEQLARFKVPKHLLLIDAADVPRTATGRPQKFLLVERAMVALGLSAE